MTDRPILFGAPMVLAILAGRKTQTRRICKARHKNSLFAVEADGAPMWTDGYILDPGNREWILRDASARPSDTFWVRENFAIVPASAYRMSDGVQQTVNPTDPDMAAIYAAGWERSIPKWRPSIHMPRWASRITLNVTDVRVERLQDISGADAMAEGTMEYPCTGPHRGPNATFWSMRSDAPEQGARTTPDRAFAALWEDINGEGSWGDNPLVWVYEFERAEP